MLRVGQFCRYSRINTLITMTGVPALNQQRAGNTQHNSKSGMSGGARPHQQHRQQHAHHPPKPQQAHAPPPSTASTHLSSTTFASIPNLSNASQRALSEVMGFSYMTEVQDQTLPVVMNGQDVLAKAKTGTGKTVAFLLPSIEALAHDPPAAGSISVLVLSPTRELASQIAKEADSLLTFHPFKSQVVYGGTNINSERNRMDRGRVDVLVATPGRLIDHLENTNGLVRRFGNLRGLVLDEADQLLEMGFRPAIEKILKFLPATRQTLLFSATMPQSVQSVAGLALRKGYSFIDTVGDEQAQTNSQVTQSWVSVPLDQTFYAVRCILRAAAAVPGHKIICFFTTARLTQYMANLMQESGFPELLEIHSRKSQSAREKASAAFRNASEAIMFTSDVSARGVDYPDVTLVMQVGQPSSKEQYIHRLGRTARAGKTGQGVLILSPFEETFVARELARDVPISQASLPALTPDDLQAVAAGQGRVDLRVKEMAYQAWLGYYNSCKGVFKDKAVLVQTANAFAASMGCDETPALLKKTIGMMGLRGVPGLRIDESGGGGRGGGGRGGGRGGGGRGGGGRGAGGGPYQGQSFGNGGGSENGGGGRGMKRSRSGQGGGRGGGRGGGGGGGRGRSSY
ncbi:putative DEAD-box ATP-dependent RNA helicase 26 [Nannochloris sp. 'desiccata']|nr:putative DEAD-box ATP-dependent RNA helicase 26 [Chlorella desiccata (nom. nud.)]